MSRGDYHTLEQPLTTDVAKPTPDASTRVGQLTALAFVLGLIVLAFRFISLGDALSHSMVNPPLLKAAMRAAAGTPVSTITSANLLPSRVPLSGFQARAMSQIARQAGQPASAEVWLAQGLADPSSAYLSQFELCLLYWNEGNRAHAREACRGTIDSATYWLNRGYVADQKGERVEALAAFQMAGSIDPELLPAWQQTGNSLYAMGRYDEAILAYERVMALEPSPPADVFHSLSRSYLELGEPLAAREILVRGLELYSNQRVLYLAMAETYRDEGDLETADNWYDRMLQRWPNDAQGWAARGETAVAAGRSRDAAGYFQEAVNIQPEDVGYWMSLAAAAAATENVALATTAYRKAMELRPNDTALWLRSGRFLAEANRIEDARAVLEHVLELEPDNGEAATLLAALDGLSRR